MLKSPLAEVSQYKLSITILAPIPILVAAMSLNSVSSVNMVPLEKKHNFFSTKNYLLPFYAMFLWFFGAIVLNDELLRNLFKSESFSVFKYLLPLFLQYSGIALSVRSGGALRLAKKQNLITRTYFINCLNFLVISPFCFIISGFTAIIWLVSMLTYINFFLLKFYASRVDSAKGSHL
jgi:hypothetical protein